MKKLTYYFRIIMIVIFLTFLFSYIYNQRTISQFKDVTIETKEDATVSEIYIYGKNLNIKGVLSANDAKEVYLSFVDKFGSKVDYLMNFIMDNDNIIFNLGDKINNGFDLEKLSIVNKYRMYLKVVHMDDSITYHKLDNKSGYETTDYYTIYKNNSNEKITISTNETLEYEIVSNDKPVFDVILDPGHGGTDSGACYQNKTPCERDYTSDVVIKIKNILEKKGVKVAFTWDVDKIKNSDYIPVYGQKSRVGSAYESYAKYLISIHLNSSSTSKLTGFEVYTPYNINYNFARNIRDNIKTYTNASYSNNKFNRRENSIYTRTFSTQEIKTTNEERKNKNLKLYNITTKTNYYYMIRETGGYMTGSFVDSPSIENREVNNYYNSNRGLESYIIELAYINNTNDLAYFKKNTSKYVNAIADSIIDELNLES